MPLSVLPLAEFLCGGNGHVGAGREWGGVRRSGFTLLELLIATAAFAIVLAAINSVYFSALRLRNHSTEAFDDDLAVQHTLTFLRRDLANLLPPGGVLSGQLQTTPSLSGSLNSSSATSGSSSANTGPSMALLAAATQPGQSSPEFYTTTAVIDETSPWSELQKVSYYLTQPTNGTVASGRSRDLVRSVTRNLLPSLLEQPVVTPLLTEVESIYFQYHDGLQWKDTWDSTTETTSRLPQAIRVQIVRAQVDRALPARPTLELVVPILTYGGTNSTETASP